MNKHVGTVPTAKEKGPLVSFLRYSSYVTNEPPPVFGDERQPHDYGAPALQNHGREHDGTWV